MYILKTIKKDITLLSSHVKEGQEIEVCVSCKNEVQTLEKKNFKIKQMKASPCLDSLSPSKKGKITLRYDKSLLAAKVNHDLINNKEPIICKVQECRLHTEDCSRLYEGKDVVLSNKGNDFEISGKTIDQQPTKVCVFCKNSHQSIEIPNIEVKYGEPFVF